MLSSSLSLVVRARLAARGGGFIGSSGTGVLQYSSDFDIGTAPGVLQRRGALLVGNVDVAQGLDQGADRGGVIGAAVAQHHRLHQRGPAEIVDVVEGRLGGDQK